MPQIGNKCPGIEEYHTFESRYCLDKCDHQCVPASVLVHIQNKVRTDVHQGEYVSATALTDSACPRQLFLERTIPYYVEPPKNWWSVRGSLLHSILQNPDFDGHLEDMRQMFFKLVRGTDVHNKDAAEKLWRELEAKALELSKLLPKQNRIEDWESEIPFQYSLGVINGKERILYGTLDVLRKTARQLIDYKTIGDKGLGVIKKGAKQDHIMQFNIYRFLAMKGHPVGMNPADYTPVEIEKITAYYMTMMEIVQTGGLLVQNSEFRLSEPEDNFLTREIVATRQDLVTKRGKRKDSANPDDFELKTKTKYRLTYAIPDVPLLPLEEVEEFIRRKAQVLFDAFDSMQVPEMVAPEVRAWKCDDYCADQIRAACDGVNAAKGVTRLVNIETDAIPVEV